MEKHIQDLGGFSQQSHGKNLFTGIFVFQPKEYMVEWVLVVMIALFLSMLPSTAFPILRK